MPTFDPTKPAANSEVSSSELRDQLNALNDSTNDQVGSLSTTVDVNNTQAWDQFHQMNNNVSPVAQLSTPFTGTPTAANLETLRAKLNELIAAIQAGAAI